jgi:asparagine synthase (glutamine-hydrolysing)
MCGITGVFGSTSSVQMISAMSSLIKHRGPDQYGEYLSNDGKLALAHQRLSILDVSKFGQQPMTSSNGNFVIIYTGDIYNFKALKALLLTHKVMTFKGHLDTEVLLECINARGVEKILPSLNGMFAFALYDTKK